MSERLEWALCPVCALKLTAGLDLRPAGGGAEKIKCRFCGRAGYVSTFEVAYKSKKPAEPEKKESEDYTK